MPLLLLIAFGLLALSGFAWFGIDQPLDAYAQRYRASTPASPLPEPRTPLLVDITARAGIRGAHLQREDHLSGRNETLGAGACVLDYDGDGWPDLLLVNGQGQNRYYGRHAWWNRQRSYSLYRNLGGIRFEQVSEDAGLDLAGWGMGCAAGDLDNDGDPDLLLTNLGRNYLYRNDGDGRFTEIGAVAGLPGEDWSTSAALGDYDGDGLLDIYIVNYLRFAKGNRTYETDFGYQRTAAAAFDPSLHDGANNELLRNLGGLRFRDVTGETGVANPGGRGLGAVWHDLNGDHRPDLLVANDQGLPDSVYLNPGNGRFQDRSADYAFAGAGASAGLRLAGIDANGDLDLILGHPDERPNQLFRRQPHADHTATFIDDSRPFGLAAGGLPGLNTWGLAVADFDLDGWNDLLLANGMASPDTVSPAHAQGQPNRLLLNRAGESLRVCEVCLPHPRAPLASRAVVLADFDRDGDLDSLITNNNGVPELLENRADLQRKRHWSMVYLEGDGVNRDALGARVWLQSGGRRQGRELSPATFLGNNQAVLHFGLGRQDHIDYLLVDWGDGALQRYPGPPVDHAIQLRQGQDSWQVLPRPTLPTETKQTAPVFFQDPNRQLTALTWLAGMVEPREADRLLGPYMVDPRPELRPRLLDIARLKPSWIGLQLAIGLLGDADARPRTEAVALLQDIESEYAGSWLLGAFDDPDPGVRCAVARAYGVFFAEEEAMVHHKALALPYLIRLLQQDPRPQVQVCALEALAEAESHRAVASILTLLEQADRVDPAVVGAGARALGLIREKAAGGPLLRLLKDRETDPANRAEAMIALVRLHLYRADELLREIRPASPSADGDPDWPARVAFLRTLNALLAQPRFRVIIPPASVEAALREFLAGFNPQSLQTAPRGAGVWTALLPLLTRSGDPLALGPATELLQQPTDTDPGLALAAYRYLLRVTTPEQQQIWLERALADPRPPLQRLAFEQVIASGQPLPAAWWRRQLAAGIDPALCAVAMGALAHGQGNDWETLIVQLLRDGKPCTPALPELLQELQRRRQVMLDLETLYPSLKDPRLRSAALEYWFARHADERVRDMPGFMAAELNGEALAAVRPRLLQLLAGRREFWATRAWRDVLLDPTQAPDVRLGILESVLQHPLDAYRKRLLQRLTGRMDDPIWGQLPAYAGLWESEESKARLGRACNQPHVSETSRFNAAQRLHEIDPRRWWRDCVPPEIKSHYQHGQKT